MCVKSLARLRECEKVSFSGRRSALTVGGQISESNEMHFSGKLRDKLLFAFPYIFQSSCEQLGVDVDDDYEK